MTDIQHFIGRVRNHYLVGLCEQIAIYNQTFDNTLSEALVEREDLHTLPPVFQLHRVDMSRNSESFQNVREFQPEDNIVFRPTKLSVNSQMKIALEPFIWNKVDFECSSFDEQARLLQKWAHYWLHDAKRHNDYGLTGCAHSVSYPQKTRDTCHFTVDFGSADVSCFVQLMQVLHRLGVRRARVYSRALYQ